MSPAVLYLETYDQFGKPLSQGSGFIVDRNGKIATNYHVIEGANTAKAFLNDGRSFNIDRVVNYDISKDIAILSIDATNLPVVKLGNSDLMTNGDRVVVIGSPLGFADTISDGLISNKLRIVNGYPYMQTSAPISSGNSGGPLINESGEVIGIITLTILQGQNLNFAIPINAVKTYLSGNQNILLTDLFKKEKIIPPSGVWAKAISSNEIQLGWGRVTGADYYHVYSSYSHAGPYYSFTDNQGAKVKLYSNSITTHSLTSDTTFYYRVTAVKNGVESDYSSIVNATTFKEIISISELQNFLNTNYSYNNIGGYIVAFDISVGYYTIEPNRDSAFILFKINNNSFNSWNNACINSPELVLDWLDKTLNQIHYKYNMQEYNGAIVGNDHYFLMFENWAGYPNYWIPQ